MFRPVGQLVGKNSIITFYTLEAFKRGHLNAIRALDVTGIRAGINIGFSLGKKCIQFGITLLGIGANGCRCREIRLGQPFNLRRIKDRVTFQKWDLAGGGFAIGILIFFRELVGIDDLRSLFAFANIGLQFNRLFIGHPVRRCITLIGSRSPEHQGIDTGIGNTVPA